MTWTGVKAARAGSGGLASRSDTTGGEASRKTKKKEGGPGMWGESGMCQCRYVN